MEGKQTADSQSDANIFSVRIVSIDYYMAPPIPGFDICYSSFQGGKVNEVPVIRIYGSTPAGQKTCLHIHRALPYLYVPCKDLLPQPHQEGDACTHLISLAVEKALKLKGNAGLKRQHVHGCSLVRAKKFYGYHSSEELFAKIYLNVSYYPHDVSRAANLLLGGAVLDRSLQPHESHIPFLLQFLVDYNLYGMGHLHVSTMKFRHPVPTSYSRKKGTSIGELGQGTDSSTCCYANFQVESSQTACFDSPVWISSTIPDGWTWQFPSQSDTSSHQESHLVRRQSICELEGDTTVDEILNQQSKMYSPLSQTCSDVKMVQSLVPIWEEYARTGKHEGTIPSDNAKPFPADVLRILSYGLVVENKLMELCGEGESYRYQCAKNARFAMSANCMTDEKNMVEPELGNQKNGHVKTLNSLGVSAKMGSVSSLRSSREEDDGTIPGDVGNVPLKQLPVHEMLTSEKFGTSDPKVTDREALRLLRWLASSQAADDVNSDDELLCETVLSPLLPAATIDKVLHKANLDYESESQQECQDILDSIEDSINFEVLNGGSAFSIDDNNARRSENTIPQVDGSADDQDSIPNIGKSSNLGMNNELEMLSQDKIWKGAGSNFASDKHKKKKPLWGSLHFSLAQVVDGDIQPASTSMTVACGSETKYDAVQSRHAETGISWNASANNSNLVACDSKEASSFTGCSVRDLMRRKRCYRVESSESVTHRVKKTHSEEEQNDLFSNPYMKAVDRLQQTDTTTGSYLSGVPTKSEILHQCAYACKKGNENSTFFPTIPELPSKNLKGIEMMTGTTVYGGEQHGRATVSAHVEGVVSNEYLSFFEGGSLEEKESQGKSCSNDDSDHHQGVVMGAPTHYQNDGSCLYLLTPLFSPPSVDTVDRWLLHEDAGILDDKFSALSAEHSSPEGSSCDQFILRGSPVDTCRKPLLQSSSICESKPIQYQLDQQTHEKFNAEITDFHKKATSRNEGKDAKEGIDSSQDLSQISGPDGKSKLTPLSQIGFRDPASVGGGEQLTLLSVEVQADSRGDLRPDPRFDAINVIVLIFQEDNDNNFVIYVLLRSKSEHIKRNFDGVSGCKVLVSSQEKQLFNQFISIICTLDPDILMGWDIQSGSLGFLAERASYLGIGLLNNISRTPSGMKVVARDADIAEGAYPQPSIVDSVLSEDTIIEDEWGRTHASGVHVGGRIVLNIWRLMRGELKLNMYSIEAVAENVLRRKIPFIHCKILTKWFSSGPGRARHQCIEYVIKRAKLNLEIMNQLDMISRTSELARIFGIDFFSVLSRGSQYRVESMLLRLAHTQNYLAISPGNQQVASQPAMECLPLVMEPESAFYADPVVVLDFQSLYPSMIIAYNLCFCTCLGSVAPSKAKTLGVSSFSPDERVLQDLKNELLITPNGVMYVPSKVRKGILPRLLEEILSTRVMVKQAMKKLAPSQQILYRIFNARQLALKLISNVTYGYTAAGFSGRMPCAELADSIVQCARRTLENAISFVNAHDKWKAKVIYGDTDSMFVYLRGRNVRESFQIGHEIASAVTAMNPHPVVLKMEKVYHPCFLLTKKRYVGYSYESLDQVKPVFDAKGIETVRRDTCGAVAKMMEQSVRLFFEQQDIIKVKAYLQRQWTRILSGRVSLEDFVFAKEVRLGTYSTRASSPLPPAAIVATKAMRVDPRAEPRYAERIPYVVVHGEPGSRLVDMVVDPLDLLAIDSPFRLNGLYYISKQIIPALQRIFGLVGADLNQWFADLPRLGRKAVAKRHSFAPNSHRTRIDYYYLSKHCVLCGELVQASAHICGKCSKNQAAVATALVGRTSKLEREIQHLIAICQHCGGGDSLMESGVTCTSLACSVFYERWKVQKELLSLSAVAFDVGLYPRCIVEWF